PQFGCRRSGARRAQFHLVDFCRPVRIRTRGPAARRGRRLIVGKVRRITLLSATLRAGGAERAALTLAEAFGRRGYEVTLLTWNAGTADFYEVPGNVVRSDAGLRTGEMFVRW